MGNTLTTAIDKIFAASLAVLRENAVMPRLVFSDYAAEVAQQGDAITIRVPSSRAVSDVTATHTPSKGDDTTTKVVTLPLDTWKRTSINMTDKEAHEIAERVSGFMETEGGEAVRALANYVDKDILSLYKKVSNVVGTPGTTPFGSGTTYHLNDATAARKLLAKNLAPTQNRYMVLDPDAEEHALRIGVLQDASHRRATPDTLTTGMIGRVMGIEWYMDQNIAEHVAGSGGKQINGAVTAGATSATVDGTGTLVDGDLVSFGAAANTAFDPDNAYAVKGDVATGGTTVEFYKPLPAIADDRHLNRPGNHVNNICFHKTALAIASRVATAPDAFTGGQMMRQAVDPVSGLTLTLTVFRQEYQTKWEWSILYGVQAVRPELAVRVLG